MNQLFHHQIAEIPLWGALLVVISEIQTTIIGVTEIPLSLLLIFIWLGSAISGLAHMYWKGGEQSLTKWVAAAITCGFLGLGVAMLLYSQYENNPLFLAGVSLFAGMGASFTIDLLKSFAAAWMARFRPPEDEKNHHIKKKV